MLCMSSVPLLLGQPSKNLTFPHENSVTCKYFRRPAVHSEHVLHRGSATPRQTLLGPPLWALISSSFRCPSPVSLPQISTVLVRNGSCQTMQGEGKGHNKTRYCEAEQVHGKERDDKGDLRYMEHGGRHGRGRPSRGVLLSEGYYQ